MISHIKGLLTEKKPGRLVIEAGGLGYEINVPLGTFMALPEAGAEVKLLTRLFIREESWELFGFLTNIERESFIALTSVTRIGPRLALSILSAMEPADFAQALMNRDLGALSTIKGIGTKTAERLLLELKEKAPKLAAMAGVSQHETREGKSIAQATPAQSADDDEAVSALVNLGYTAVEANRGVKAALKQIGAEEANDLGLILKIALKHLNSRK